MKKKKKSENTDVWKIYSSMKTKQIGTHTGIFSHHSRVFKKKEKILNYFWHFLMATYLVVMATVIFGSISRYGLFFFNLKRVSL